MQTVVNSLSNAFSAMAGMGTTAVRGVVSIFTTPPRYTWGLIGLGVAFASFGFYLKTRWVEADPSNWMLIIRNGEMLKAGVGMKTFVGPMDTVVTFPAKVERVPFQTENTTVEMQGVTIKGFTFWSTRSDSDGPFRCYKYMMSDGSSGNGNVQALCESALRSLIANTNLDKLLRDREWIREQVLKELKPQFAGWGVEMESIEITEVNICSGSLFKNLQAKFTQETQLKAQQIELESTEKYRVTEEQYALNTVKQDEQNATKKAIHKNNETIKREKEQTEFEIKRLQLDLERKKREIDLDMQRIKANNEQDIEKVKNELKLSKEISAFERELILKDIEIDENHDLKSLEKYRIDMMDRIYNKVGFKEIRVNQFVGDSKSSLASLLPQMGYLAAQMQPMQ